MSGASGGKSLRGRIWHETDTGWPIGPGGEAAPYPDISDNMDMFGVRCLILYESRCKWSICRPNAKQR